MDLSSEQWLASGDCSECRKQAYCTKACKARQQRHKSAVSNAVGRALSKTQSGQFLSKASAILSHSTN